MYQHMYILDIGALERQHRKFIRSILNLSQRTAIPSLHTLSSILSIEATLNQLLRTSLCNPGPLQDIIIIWVAAKDTGSYNWTMREQSHLEEI